MKTRAELTALPVLVLFLTVLNAKAAVFANLHNFDGSAGAVSYSHLVLSGQTLYGTTANGGNGSTNDGYGTVFKINTDGSGFTCLYSFTNGTAGANPAAGLVISGSCLYGTTSSGGESNGTGYGTVFKISTDGTGFTNLYNFSDVNDGVMPAADLLLSGSSLYGTTKFGGPNSGVGTVFKIDVDGTGFTNLYSFTNDYHDGAEPVAGLILLSNTLYGTTSQGGIGGFGNVFKVSTDGSHFEVLHDFTFSPNDGRIPLGGLVSCSNILYGTTETGGTTGSGTVFKLNTDGTGFAILYSFTNGTDGAFVESGLEISGNELYGTVAGGQGSAGYGTIFEINTDGTGFSNLYNFTPVSDITIGFTLIQTNGDGALPEAAVSLSGNTLYGTVAAGGVYGKGTVFALSLGPVVLNVQRTGNSVILNWGNPAFSLQAAPFANGVYSNIPGATSPFTNVITDPPQFFRLRSN